MVEGMAHFDHGADVNQGGGGRTRNAMKREARNEYRTGEQADPLWVDLQMRSDKVAVNTLNHHFPMSI